MAKKSKKKTSKKAVKKSSKKVAKKASTPAKKPAKKSAKKKARRTTMYSSGGKKLYAVRAADGTFKDIQQYSTAHAADLRASSNAEEAAEAKNSTPSAGM